MDHSELEILSNEKIPETVREKLASAFVEKGRSDSDRELERERLKLERWRSLGSTQLVAAVCLFLGALGTYYVDSFYAQEETEQQITIDQVRGEITESEVRSRQELELNTRKSLAQLEAEAREREFQYEIIRSELADFDKSTADRAAVLLFLVRAGVLNSLNEDEIRKMAEQQVQEPDTAIVPKLTSGRELDVQVSQIDAICPAEINFRNYDVELVQERPGTFYYRATVEADGDIPEDCALVPVATDAGGVLWIQDHGWITRIDNTGSGTSDPIAVDKSSSYPLQLTFFLLNKTAAREALKVSRTGFSALAAPNALKTVGESCKLSRSDPKISCE